MVRLVLIIFIEDIFTPFGAFLHCEPQIYSFIEDQLKIRKQVII